MGHRHCAECWVEMDHAGPLCQVCYIKEDITKTLERIQAQAQEEEEEGVPSFLRRLSRGFGSW